MTTSGTTKSIKERIRAFANNISIDESFNPLAQDEHFSPKNRKTPSPARSPSPEKNSKKVNPLAKKKKMRRRNKSRDRVTNKNNTPKVSAKAIREYKTKKKGKPVDDIQKILSIMTEPVVDEIHPPLASLSCARSRGYEAQSRVQMQIEDPKETIEEEEEESSGIESSDEEPVLPSPLIVDNSPRINRAGQHSPMMVHVKDVNKSESDRESVEERKSITKSDEDTPSPQNGHRMEVDDSDGDEEFETSLSANPRKQNETQQKRKRTESDREDSYKKKKYKQSRKEITESNDDRSPKSSSSRRLSGKKSPNKENKTSLSLRKQGKKLKDLAKKMTPKNKLEGFKYGMVAGLKFVEGAHLSIKEKEKKDWWSCSDLFRQTSIYFDYYCNKYRKINEDKLSDLASLCSLWCNYHAMIIMKHDIYRRSKILGSKLGQIVENSVELSPQNPSTPTIKVSQGSSSGTMTKDMVREMTKFLKDCKKALSPEFEKSILEDCKERLSDVVSWPDLEKSDLAGFLSHAYKTLE